MVSVSTGDGCSVVSVHCKFYKNEKFRPYVSVYFGGARVHLGSTVDRASTVGFDLFLNENRAVSTGFSVIYDKVD